MITQEFAAAFASEWVSAWNSHDLEKILSFYADDFTIETPMAAKLYPQSQGIVTGKMEVRNYWTIGLEKSPYLKFRILECFISINSVALYLYNFSSGKSSVELMSFNGEMKVNRAIVLYSK